MPMPPTGPEKPERSTARMPGAAMLLAAGLGMRMRPLTETLPKPLVPVGGVAMIDRVLASVARAGVARTVVNVHHLADRIVEHLARRSVGGLLISDEREELLGSGGGIVKALPLLGAAPFFVINTDTFWLEPPGGGPCNLTRLARLWNPAAMDILLMTVQADEAIGHDGRGDFVADAAGRLTRLRNAAGMKGRPPLVHAGAGIVNPVVFEGAPAGSFDVNACVDAVIADGRLFGMPVRGLWLTVGTVAAIDEAEAAMAAYERDHG